MLFFGAKVKFKGGSFLKIKDLGQDFVCEDSCYQSHRIHVFTYIYLHLPQKSTIHVGKYTSPMDPMGIFLSIMHPFGVVF